MTQTNFSVAELERILDARKADLQDLGRRRETAQKALDDIDQEIHNLVGDGSGLGRLGKRHRRRPKNEKSLRAIVLEVLGQHKAGLTLATLAGKVTETGYKSNSRNFRNVLYQCLYNTAEIQHDDSSGCYKIVKVARTAK